MNRTYQIEAVIDTDAPLNEDELKGAISEGLAYQHIENNIECLDFAAPPKEGE